MISTTASPSLISCVFSGVGRMSALPSAKTAGTTSETTASAIMFELTPAVCRSKR